MPKHAQILGARPLSAVVLATLAAAAAMIGCHSGPPAPGAVSTPAANMSAGASSAQGRNTTAAMSSETAASNGAMALRPEKPLTPIAITPADVEDAVNAAPADFELRMEAAAYYLQHGLYSQAIHDLQSAIRIRPHSVIARIALADAQSAGGQQAESLHTYREAIASTPENALAYRGLGQLLVREGKLDQARQVLEEGLRKNPDNPDVEIALGNLYLVLQMNSRAKAVLQPAVKQRPREAEAHYLLGLAYERELHINGALKEAQTAVALDPTLYQAWAAIGIYLVKLEHYSQARTALFRAIRLAPQVARYYQLLGDAYYKDLSSTANQDHGIRYYRQALTLDPNDVKTLIALGTALTDRNRPADRAAAIPVLKRVISLRPMDKEPFYRLAQVYREMGRNAEAAELLRRFEELAASDARQRKKPAVGSPSSTGTGENTSFQHVVTSASGG